MRLLVFALAFAVVQGVDSSKQPASKPSVQRQNTKAEVRGTARAPVIVQMVRTPQDSAEASERRKNENEKAHNDSRLAGATVALAVLTGLLFLATGFLAYFTYQLWTDTQAISVRQLRAYIGMDEMRAETEGPIWHVSPKIRNMGQSQRSTYESW